MHLRRNKLRWRLLFGTQVEDNDSSSEVETVSDDDDEDEGAWLEPSHGGGNLPAAVRRRLVPTVSSVVGCVIMLGCIFSRFHP